jgi:hypothetical protein
VLVHYHSVARTAVRVRALIFPIRISLLTTESQAFGSLPRSTGLVGMRMRRKMMKKRHRQSTVRLVVERRRELYPLEYSSLKREGRGNG